jgi:hypothetical protein
MRCGTTRTHERGERGRDKGSRQVSCIERKQKEQPFRNGKELEVRVLHTELNMIYDPLLPSLYTFQEGKGEAAPTLAPLPF